VSQMSRTDSTSSVDVFVSFSYCASAHPDLHSFPTRRSSDLGGQCDRRDERAFAAREQKRREGHQRADAERKKRGQRRSPGRAERSEEHTSELQSLRHLVCRLLLEKKKKKKKKTDCSKTNKQI